ncbi:pollen-specific leucine-rich repeat extensin-like protein 3 [Iris pallida]|uniref:Pollen-specific leucine-rich repeat extensin-like protein 3 n=1 Tax=Iris pallida TaxID=29817 RepID=A0AAX6G7Q1_IRIPA|nr:pollen-specific leucine-rich repeat extensin-like protein 3 [Iris pallida]
MCSPPIFTLPSPPPSPTNHPELPCSAATHRTNHTSRRLLLVTSDYHNTEYHHLPIIAISLSHLHRPVLVSIPQTSNTQNSNTQKICPCLPCQSCLTPSVRIRVHTHPQQNSKTQNNITSKENKPRRRAFPYLLLLGSSPVRPSALSTSSGNLPATSRPPRRWSISTKRFPLEPNAPPCAPSAWNGRSLRSVEPHSCAVRVVVATAGGHFRRNPHERSFHRSPSRPPRKRSMLRRSREPLSASRAPATDRPCPGAPPRTSAGGRDPPRRDPHAALREFQSCADHGPPHPSSK